MERNAYHHHSWILSEMNRPYFLRAVLGLEKIKWKEQRVPIYPYPIFSLFLTCGISGILVIINRPILIHNYELKSIIDIRVHSQ